MEKYTQLFNDLRWIEKRNSIMERDGYNCVIPGCSNPKGKHLQVHHRQYHFSTVRNSFVNPWEYDDDLLITLCNWCHSKGHRVFGNVPIKNINW